MRHVYFQTVQAFPVLKQRTWRSSYRNQDACSKGAYLPCYARASFSVSGEGLPRYSLDAFPVTAHRFPVRPSLLRPFPFPVSPLTPGAVATNQAFIQCTPSSVVRMTKKKYQCSRCTLAEFCDMTRQVNAVVPQDILMVQIYLYIYIYIYIFTQVHTYMHTCLYMYCIGSVVHIIV